MKITDSYDDSTPGSKTRRIFYNFELEDGVFVDIMVSDESQVVYAMQKEDGREVYDNDGTCPGYAFDEEAAIRMAVDAYEKEYGKISWHSR